MEVSVCLANLGNILMMQKRFEEARSLLDRALSIAQANKSTRDAATVKACMGSLLRKEAETLYKESIAEHKKSLGVEHPLVADDLFAYAKCLDKMDRTKEASAVRARAEKIRKDHGIPLPTAAEQSHD